MADQKKKKIQMNHQQCAEHSETAEGTQPLRNPQLVKKTSMDINRGLYPRPKRTNEDSNDQSLQKGNANFSPKRKFMDDVPSMAKLKMSSPSTSLLRNDLVYVQRNRGIKNNGSLIDNSQPSTSTTVQLEENEHVLKSCVQRNLNDQYGETTEGTEFDTDSLEDDVMIRASQELEKQCGASSASMDINMQAFEDDSFLDSLNSDLLDNMEMNSDQPNTFGLLGDSSCGVGVDEEGNDCHGVEEEDGTFGYLTYLPDEILERIFSYLSINACCNISTVCKRWRRIILSHKFLPWKKLYQRYKMSEECGVLEVDKIYTTHSFSDAKSCLLSLIRYMATFKSINSSSVSFMKHHPMFELSCDLLAERSPDLIVQGVPNIWSLLTTLVILSRSTHDISQAIKYSLNSEYKHVALIECFYCIATILLMLQKKHQINCGLHYRLYYALYHYEMGCSLSYSSSRMVIKVLSDNSSEMPASKHVMTQEQVAIVSYKLRPNEIVKIIAFAGTGKTSTLVHYTLRNPSMRFLYVAFNRAIKEHAVTLFPSSNVECKTTHSLAYRDVGSRYRDKLSPSWNINNVVSVLQPEYKSYNHVNHPLYVRAQIIIKTIKAFVASVDNKILLDHVPHFEKEEGGGRGTRRQINPERRKTLYGEARDLWRRMCNPRDKEARITHDVYLKLYQLSKPKLYYDCILIDEAQDLTPAQQDILLSQDCSKILVGDPHQQIYSFRGATNALQNIPATKVFHLTQSFRFGPEIAYVADCLLLQNSKSKKKKNVIGIEASGSVLGQVVGQIAVICRTNLCLFNELCKLTEQNQNVRIALVGGVKNYRFEQILDIHKLLLPKSDRTKPGNEINDKFISKFCNLSQLERYADSVDDLELLNRIAIVKTHHAKIPEHIKRIKSRVQDDLSLAEVVFSTAHKSKGLEFDSVKLTCDFVAQVTMQIGFDGVQIRMIQQNIPDDELNLLYVALTRAKKRLKLTSPILKMLAKLNETFTYPVSTKTVIGKDGDIVVKCLECTYKIEPTTVLIFERLKVNLEYSDQAFRPGGFLCPICAAATNKAFASLVTPT
ncbi:F-box DNA helicase 1-like [Antedon mediterranea]|uniref:F-box DNA helicase 1-like n=1 Tax=Antedon mediterranea TaxID=105859 RepID=UPI003AF66D1A